MRLKFIAVFLFISLIAVMTSLSFAQEGGGKPLPGELSPTPTTTPTSVATADSPTDAPTDAPTELPTQVPTEEPEDEPTETEASTGNDDEPEFPADMLEQADLEFDDVELVLFETFDDDDAWELGNYENGTMEIDDGVYVIDTGYGGVLWGQNEDVHGDVVIQVTIEQLSDEDNNGFGVMCRAAPENNLDGYHFWISGDGFATIFKHEDEEFEDLEPWVETDTINQGQDTNVITVVCVGEYLGFWVNGELVLETEDDSFETGVTGLGAYIFEEDENVEVAFDNVTIWQIGDAPEVDADPTEEEEEDPEDENEETELDVDQTAEDVADALGQGDIEIELGDILTADDFSDEGAWDNVDDDTTVIEVNDGVYYFEEGTDFLYSWAMNQDEDEYEDVVISVDAEQTSRDEETGYGPMCRLQDDGSGDGYTFLIGADGYYTIGYWEDGEFFTLTEGNSDAVNQGRDTNTIYVVCVGEYLALYANGELIDEVEDDTFDSGFTALAVVSFIDEPVVVEFDNLYVWEAND
jgi:hypothetical protein